MKEILVRTNRGTIISRSSLGLHHMSFMPSTFAVSFQLEPADSATHRKLVAFTLMGRERIDKIQVCLYLKRQAHGEA